MSGFEFNPEARKYFIVDCEFGGLTLDATLLTLHGIVVNQDLTVLDEISLAMKPDDGKYVLTADSMRINKIDFLKHDEIALKLSEAREMFYNFLWKHSPAFEERLVVVGHNVHLDIDFIKKYLLTDTSFCGNSWSKFFSHRVVDTSTITQTLQLAKLLPYGVNSLQDLANHFNFDYSGGHDAKFDAELTLKILQEQIKLMAKKGL